VSLPDLGRSQVGRAPPFGSLNPPQRRREDTPQAQARPD